ncbi:sugar dehydrogenase complex small subunit [Kitasatospora sp. NPDC057965]|uniref:sugar dehydrogenase complex small subunit n=1 Tax=Kitasatospora sp. NPDC057965 TaxID=3346291 RepID=UPI0036DB8871
MSDATDFLALSELLTGEASLDATRSDEYLQRLTAAFPADVPRLLDAYRTAAGQPDPATALVDAVNADPALARITRETVTVWYLAQFSRPDGKPDTPTTAAQYQDGLLWRVIKAKAPGTTPQPPSPDGYGYWTKQP